LKFDLEFRKDEEIVEEVVKKEEVKIEPVVVPQAKQVQERIVHQVLILPTTFKATTKVYLRSLYYKITCYEKRV
jgi:hypothetical protein